MNKILKYCLFLIIPLFAVSCSESEGEDEEFANWQEVNANYFATLYNTTQQKIAGGDTSWKLLKKWSLEDNMAVKPTDFIVVHVLEEGKGTTTPIFTNTACVHYSGKLLPSASFPSGYVFAKSYSGTLDEEVATPAELAISSVSYPMTNGLATALQQMHVGDKWEIYIPAELAWAEQGTTDSSTGATLVPPYSMIIMEVVLAGIE